MPTRINIRAGKISAVAELNSSRTAAAIVAKLPLESRAQRIDNRG